jgi:hypothetical protein
MNESYLSLERTFEVLISHRDEMSEVVTEAEISSIRALEYKGAAEDRAHLRHQSESPTSSLGRDGAGAKTRVGLVWR